MSREVLDPPLQRMGNNRCYRVNLVHADFGGHPVNQEQQRLQPAKQGYVEQDLYAEDDDDDEDGACTVEDLPNGMFKLTMHGAQHFYGGIIGFKGSTKRRIESETQTDIFVPRNKSEDVTIKGKNRSNVCAARRKIRMLIASMRKRMRATHFLCVPLNSGKIREQFIELKKSILAENYAGIDEQLFQRENCIHLTIGTCVLLDDSERAKAVELLQSLRQLLADLKTPFEVRVSGLEIMNDDPSAVRILYGRVDAPHLQEFANRALRPFNASGLANENRDTIKMHMTLMNTKFRKNLNEQAANNFDARDILKRFANFDFGTARCSEVQLCVVGSRSEEFYKATGTLKF